MVFVNGSFAQPGALDTTFGVDGKVTTAIGAGYDYLNSVAVQIDGKIVVAGGSDSISSVNFALARYNPDGSLDNSFSTDGKLTTIIGAGGYSKSVVIQGDGKIVAAGRAFNGFIGEFAVVRYNTDGTLDGSFGNSGKVVTSIGGLDSEGNSVIIQSDGKIVVTGFSINGVDANFTLVRYNANGTMDSSFGANGIVMTSFGSSVSKARSAVLQTDGKIIAEGDADSGTNSDFALARYNTDGTLDCTFSNDGRVLLDINATLDVIFSTAIQTDRKIITAGSSLNGTKWDFALARFNPDGTLDSTFSYDGKITTSIGTHEDRATSVIIQPDGRIVVAGSSTNTTSDFALVRYNSDGSLDNSFGTNGIVITPIGMYDDIAYSAALQSNGRIVAAGFSDYGTNYDFALARYLSGLNIGILEFSTSDNSVLIYPNPIQQNAVLEYTLKEQEEISIQLFDMQGKMIKTFIEKETLEAGDHRQTLVLPEDLAAGSYVIVISSGSGKVSVKIVK